MASPQEKLRIAFEQLERVMVGSLRFDEKQRAAVRMFRAALNANCCESCLEALGKTLASLLGRSALLRPSEDRAVKNVQRLVRKNARAEPSCEEQS